MSTIYPLDTTPRHRLIDGWLVGQVGKALKVRAEANNDQRRGMQLALQQLGELDAAPRRHQRILLNTLHEGFFRPTGNEQSICNSKMYGIRFHFSRCWLA
jgi:hypothetical protein